VRAFETIEFVHLWMYAKFRDVLRDDLQELPNDICSFWFVNVPANDELRSLAHVVFTNDDGNPMTDTTGSVTEQMRNSDQKIRLSGNGESH
jgi:hypothetical protein